MLHPPAHRYPGSHLLSIAPGFLHFSEMVALWPQGMVGYGRSGDTCQSYSRGGLNHCTVKLHVPITQLPYLSVRP